MDETHDELCIKSIKEVIIETIVPLREDFDFGEALSSIYPLLELIFEYLPFNDLRSCSKVCDSWQKVATKLMQNRRAPSYFMCYMNVDNKRKRKHVVLTLSHNLHFNNVALGLLFLDSTRLGLHEYICLHKFTEPCKKNIPEFLEEELIPKSVDYGVLSVPGVFSNFDKRRVRLKDDTGSLFSGVLLPKIPNIKITMFHCNPPNKSELRKTINTHKKSDENVKCLLIFWKVTLPSESVQDLLMVFAEDYIINGDNPSQIALGGGLVRGTKTFQVNSQKRVFPADDTVCIAFLEKRGVPSKFMAYSCVIKSRTLTTATFEDHLTEFRQRCTLKKHSFCFLIRCITKYESESELLLLFEKVFSGVPLLGLDSSAEIGWNSVDHNNVKNDDKTLFEKEPKRKKNPVLPEVYHIWSNVFVIITWE